MGKLLLSIVLAFFLHSLSAQTFNGTGGAIPDNGATATCFPLTVSGIGTINGSHGLQSVCLAVTHTWDADLEISLKAPDGTIIPLSIQNGGTGDDYTGTCFTAAATNSIAGAAAPFNGNYLPEGNLGNANNGQNADGTWSLCVQDIAGGSTGILNNWSITFSSTPARPLAPPANDDPCNAIVLTVGSTCIYSTYTNAGATNSTGVPAPGCSNYTGSDVWFQVTVPAGGILNFDTQTGSMTDGGMAIYSGTCNALTLIDCNDDGSSNGLMPMIPASGLTPGSTVWIRMWEYGNDNNGTFGICVTAPTPPPPVTNDNPCTALALPATTTCSYTTYTNAGATGTTGVPAPGCASYSGSDVWFTVTVPPGGAITLNTQEGTLTDGGMAIYSGTCSSLTLIGCDDDGSPNGGGYMPMIVATGLTPGSTIWVRMWEYGNDNNGTFGICATIPIDPPGCSSTTPAGNTCTSATAICNFNGYCGNTSASYTDDYWPELFDAFDNCLGGGTSIENNSFISFVASATTASFNVWVTNSLYGDGIQMMFYEGGCGSGPVTCHGGYNDITGGPNLISATGLVPGNTYYLMVDGVAGDVCDYTFDPVSGVDALGVTPDAATICAGASVNLTASGGNGVYSWGPAAGLNTTSGATVTATPAITTVYTVTSTGTGACPVALTKKVTIAVVSPPAAPLTSPVSYCVGATAAALTANGTNLLWYTVASGGVGSSTAPTPSTAVDTTLTYWVSQSTGSCESARSSITVTVSSGLPAPVVTSPVKYCQDAPAIPLTATGSNLLWYTTLSGGVGSSTAPTPPTGTPGSVTYYVSQSSGSCPSPRAAITVIINSVPLVYAHGSNPGCSNLCDGTATVDVSGGTGPFSYLWSNAGNTKTITGLCANTYTVVVTDSNGCVSNTIPAVVPGCFQIQSILVDACSTTEYDQEMVFFQVGQTPLSTASTNITWPTSADSWNGYCTNAAFIASVNASITGGGIVLPVPIGGTIPANANVVLISSTPPTSANSFANLTDTLYALFQCPGNTQGHFANNTAAAGVRTLIMNFGAGCVDSVSYNTNQLINTNGTTGGSAAINNGAYVNYAGTGTATYLNYGCTIPYTIQSSQVILTAPLAVTPTFTAIAPVCQGAAAPVLPTSSNNAIAVTGSWSPAVSTASAGTTTYTFTPDAGQCATTATMSITVNACSGSFGEFASAPYLTNCSNNVDTGKFYNSTGTGINLVGGIPYQNANLGNFVQHSGNLILNGGEIKTFKSPALANVCGTQLFYTVYTGARPASPVFTPINLPFFSNCVAGNFSDPFGGPCSPGDQKWQAINSGIDLTGYTPGNYTLEIYYQIVGDNNSTSLCRDTVYSNNGGSNFVSNFTIISPAAVAFPSAAYCSSINTWQSISFSGPGGGIFTATPAGLSINSAGGAILPSASTPGTYTVKYKFNDQQGCADSAITTVRVIPTTASTTNVSICPSQLPYTWNGNIYNTGGVYKDTLLNAGGCDSVVTLNLTIKAVSASTTVVSICPSQLPYTWNSNMYNTGGTYKDTLLNAGGCDSVVTLNLTIKAVSANTTSVSICPSQLPYTWNSNVYNAGGTYKDTLLNAGGCDSVVILNLTIKAVSASTTNVSICPSQLPYTWNSNVYNAGGTYKDTLLNAGGCDSVATLNLTIKAVSVSTTNLSICPSQLPYTWNSNVYNTGGTYKDTLLNAGGCDSVVTLNLTIKAVSASTTNLSICPSQLPYTWNGNIYNAGGTYKDTLLNAGGCDSVVTLNLTIKTVSASTTNVSICPSQLPYTWNSNVYNAGGTYKDTLLNLVGCDSVVTLNLTIKAVSASTTNVSICPSQLPYTWNSNVYNTGGTYKDTLLNAGGCDSVVTLNLTIKAVSSSTTNVSICPSQLPYTWNSNVYNAGGDYTINLTNAGGCDSIATLHLTVKSTSSSNSSILICQADLPYTWNSHVYNGDGNYSVTLVNAAGCDSIASLHLTVNNNTSGITNTSVCPAQLPYTWNGNQYSIGGLYSILLLNTAGCDSTATLNLTVSTISSTTTNVSICAAQLPYSWGSHIINSAGIYADTLTGSSGCDSVSTLALTVKAISTSVTNLSICPSQLPYTWNSHICNSGGTYKDTLLSSGGCDSIATLNLSVKAISTSITNVSVCPAQLPYSWNGNSFNTGGAYKATLTNTAGCDSIATLNLTVNPISTNSTSAVTCADQLPYSWNGNNYTATGSYNDTLINAAGCDSIATLHLTVKASSSSTTNISICQDQLPFIWNGSSYSIGGIYSKTLTNAAGCDSVATLDLTVKAITTSSTTVSICSSALPYSWNGNSYTTGGIYYDTLVNTAGCDSIASLSLTIKQISASSINTSICPAQLPYNWNGHSYNTGGTYVVTLMNAAGCDSTVTLQLTISTTSSTTTTVSICPSQLPYTWNGHTINSGGSYADTLAGSSGCDSVSNLVLTVGTVSSGTASIAICPAQLPYNWNGQTINAAGIYTDTLVGASGCDSVATLNLTVKAITTSTTNTSICPSQLPYTWNGNIYNAGGTYKDTLVNSAGCDSVVTLKLTVNLVTTSTTNITVCPAQLPYRWNGNTYTAGGTYKDTLVNSAGCDSIATLKLTVKANSSSTTHLSICPAQLPYAWNGNSYNGAGTYNVTLINAAGCDSIATLQLTVKAISSGTTQLSICPAQLPYAWNGNSYNGAGIYNVTLINAAGCDSIATLKLTVKATSTSITNVSICPAQLPYAWNGNSYNGAGTYNVTLVNAAGCDSIATLRLTIKPTSASTTNINICPSQLPFNWNGHTYNAGGTNAVTLVNSVGCDSVATLVLHLNSNSSGTLHQLACTSQLPFTWNGNEYTTAGTYHATLVNAAGCDSLTTLELSIASSPVVSLGSDTSLCPGESKMLYPGNYDRYLWQDLSMLSSYKVSQPGRYTVTVANNSGCESSASINIQYLKDCSDIFFPTAITPDGNNNNDKFGPGPSSALARVTDYSLYIYNRYGELVFSTNDPYKRWDGIFRRKEFGNVNFVWYSRYLLNGKERKVQKGNLVVIR